MIDENNIEDFEQFLKNQADKHRMYPSDQIWRNINQQLHGNSRWPALTFAAILTGALVTAGLVFLHPDKDLFKLIPAIATAESNIDNGIAINKPNPATPATINITRLKPVDEKTVMYAFNTPLAFETEQVVSNSRIAQVSALNTPIKDGLNDNGAFNNIVQEMDFKPANQLLLADSKFSAATVTDISDNDEGVVANNTVTSEPNSASEAFSPTGDNTELPEQILASLSLSGKKKGTNHLLVQLYGGSSISYRILSESLTYDDHFPFNAALSADPRKNVNNFVSQRPSIGFEFGAAMAYPLNDRIKLKAGLQFNYRQYSIDAFRASPEPAVLLINSGATSSIDSVIVYSAIRNGDGYKPLTIQNSYYQIGLPVGIDWTFAAARKVNFSFGATLQPTYQLNTNMYIITSDYKSYVQQPNLVRRWNFNAGAEAMANFDAGGLKWQIGPQVRYQMLPSQLKNYSVNEHLIDYGIKFGIIKQLK